MVAKIAARRLAAFFACAIALLPLNALAQATYWPVNQGSAEFQEQLDSNSCSNNYKTKSWPLQQPHYPILSRRSGVEITSGRIRFNSANKSSEDDDGASSSSYFVIPLQGTGFAFPPSFVSDCNGGTGTIDHSDPKLPKIGDTLVINVEGIEIGGSNDVVALTWMPLRDDYLVNFGANGQETIFLSSVETSSQIIFTIPHSYRGLPIDAKGANLSFQVVNYSTHVVRPKFTIRWFPFGVGGATTTELVSSPNPSVFGEPVTLTATVELTDTGGPAEGTVTFLLNGSPIGEKELVDGVATLVTGNGFPVGNHTITAHYNGGDAEPSTSAPLTQTVVNPTRQLQVGKTGNGIMTRDPVGIPCGFNCSEYTYGQSVTVAATPASDWIFARWGGACNDSKPTCTISMTAHSAVTALFTPTIPRARAATLVSSTQFTANWTASAVATEYQIDVARDAAFTDLRVTGSVGNTLSFSHGSLTPNTTYYYRVRAVAGPPWYITTGNSNVVRVTTLGVPPLPPVATAATNVVGSRFTANWNASDDATGYRLDVSTSSAFADFVPGYSHLDVGNTTSHSVMSLNPNTTYHYRLRAYNANGISSNSNSIAVATTEDKQHSPIAAGAYHTCAVTSPGGVRCWGANASGQLGDGTTTARLRPVDVTGLGTDVVALTAGDSHTCALTANGAVVCWGDNWSGQLGDGTTTSRESAAQVRGLTNGIVAVAAGSYHTCAVTGAGRVKCWGYNARGQLGDGTTVTRLTPVTVRGLLGGNTGVAGGFVHTCALTRNDKVKCWGANYFGQLGDGTTTDRLLPVNVRGLAGTIAAVATRDGHTCVLTDAGGLKCWGSNSSGELGDGTTSSRSLPKNVRGLTKGVAEIAAGGSHTCATIDSGGAKCWGYNPYGQLGDGTKTDRMLRAAVNGLAGRVSAIATGNYHTCAMMGADTIKCWGLNREGQLGDGTRRNRLTPVDVVEFADGLRRGTVQGMSLLPR